MTHQPTCDDGKVLPTDRKAVWCSPERLYCMSGKALLTGGRASSIFPKRLFRGFGKVIPEQKRTQLTDWQHIKQTAWKSRGSGRDVLHAHTDASRGVDTLPLPCRLRIQIHFPKNYRINMHITAPFVPYGLQKASQSTLHVIKHHIKAHMKTGFWKIIINFEPLKL